MMFEESDNYFLFNFFPAHTRCRLTRVGERKTANNHIWRLKKKNAVYVIFLVCIMFVLVVVGGIKWTKKKREKKNPE